MARITVEDCLTQETNRFALVQLAAKRTKQLLRGAKNLTKEKHDNKAVVTALREIADGRVRFMTEEESRIALELAAAEEEQAQQSAPVSPAATEVLSPLEQAKQIFASDTSTRDEDEAAPANRNGDGVF